MAGIVLQLSNYHDQEINKLEGNTYQVHLLPGNRLMLYLVEITMEVGQCPVVVGGERCCEKVGHKGKHMWAGGD